MSGQVALALLLPVPAYRVGSAFSGTTRPSVPAPAHETPIP